MNTGNVFAGLRGATVSEKGVWLREGNYVVQVKRAVRKTTRTKGDAFILEFLIVKSNYLEMKTQYIATLQGKEFKMEELEKILPNQAGTSASWYQSLQDKAVGFGAVKGFAASILGVKPEDPAFIEGVETFMAQVCNGEINGRLIPIETVMTKTAKDKDFTRYNFGVMLPAGTVIAGAPTMPATPPTAPATQVPATQMALPVAPPSAASFVAPPAALPARIHNVPAFLAHNPGADPNSLTPDQDAQWTAFLPAVAAAPDDTQPGHAK